MRVGLVTFAGGDEAAGAGGVDTVVAGLADELTRLGHEVVLFSRRGTAAPVGDDAAEPWERVELEAGPADAVGEARAVAHVGDFAVALRGQLRRRQVDVLHSHGWLAGLAAQLANRDDPVPVAHTRYRVRSAASEDVSAQHDADSHARAERAVLRHADRVVAVSHAERELLLAAGVPGDHVTVIPPAVDTDRLRPEGPTDPRGCRHRVVVFGGQRAAEQLVQVLPALADTELVVVLDRAPDHDGESAGRLHGLAVGRGVGDRVRVLPRPGALVRLVRSADVVLSFAEPGQVDAAHLVAMACSVPVLAGSPEVAEAVVDGITGVHLPDTEPPHLARLIRDLLDDSALRQGMGLAGRDRIDSRYNRARIAAETARMYDELVTPADGSTAPPQHAETARHAQR